MWAITHSRYGSADVLRIQEVDRPALGDDEVLIQVHAAGLDRGTWHFMTGLPYAFRLACGLRAPKNPVLGLDTAGTIVATGARVTRFTAGDEVFGVSRGAFAEYAAAREGKLARKPANLTFEQAAVLGVSGVTALQGLRDAGRLAARAARADHRRFRRRRHVRRADRQGHGSRGHRGVQHRQDRPGPVHRRRPRPRLHPRRHHRRSPPLRPHPRSGRQHTAVPAAPRAHGHRDARPRGRRTRRPLDRHGPPGASRGPVPVRPAAADHAAVHAGPAPTSNSWPGSPRPATSPRSSARPTRYTGPPTPCASSRAGTPAGNSPSASAPPPERPAGQTARTRSPLGGPADDPGRKAFSLLRGLVGRWLVTKVS